jgi:F0F1-type ATP synthase assembly protein I
MNPLPPESEDRAASRMAQSFGLAMSIPASVVAPFVAGYYADRWLATSPWLLIVCGLGGLTSGGLLLFRLWKMMGSGGRDEG